MDNKETLLLILGGTALYALATSQAFASIWQGGTTPAPFDPYQPDGNEMPASSPEDTTQPGYTQEQKLRAFARSVMQFESGGDYNIIFGGQRFSGYADHPRVKVYFTDPRTGRRNYSDAAGAWQFLSSTWDTWARRLGLTDFSPESQDKAGYAQLAELGVPAALAANDVPRAYALASRVWASLPGSAAQQNPQTLQTALATFESYLTA